MRKVARTAAAAMLLLLLPGVATAQDARFGWLVGDWREDIAGTWTTEHWHEAPDGTMTGSSGSGQGPTVREIETMTISRDGDGAVFTARPGGATSPTAFRQTARGAQDVTFENPGHDYPQRIRYWREGDTLRAEISMKDGSRAMNWRYRRIK